MPSETINLAFDDVTFRVTYEGPKGAPPVMFSNSLGTSLEMWDAQASLLAESRRVVRYDVRGHGETSATPGPYTIAQLANDALRILDSLHLHKVDWVGCSMGGMVGQWLLTHHRDRIGKAVLSNTAAFMGPPFTDWNGRIRTAHTKGLDSIADAMKARWFTPRFVQSNPDEVARVTGMLRKASPAGYAGCCSAIRDMDQRESIKSITNPVLVIIGSEDPATPAQMGDLIVQNIQGAQRVIVQASHLSNCEVPDAYNAAIRAFLEV
ncbi:MhpC Predicted hydrolases or acyltransferases (alpha/beta hydrolase superfamily) [Rhabdaerophilaceae bacterium]